MKHLGILATTMEGAALCSRVFCQRGSIELGPHDHPDVTLDCIALARSLPAWERADYQAVRATLSVSGRVVAARAAQQPGCPKPRSTPRDRAAASSARRTCAPSAGDPPPIIAP